MAPGPGGVASRSSSERGALEVLSQSETQLIGVVERSYRDCSMATRGGRGGRGTTWEAIAVIMVVPAVESISAVPVGERHEQMQDKSLNLQGLVMCGVWEERESGMENCGPVPALGEWAGLRGEV